MSQQDAGLWGLWAKRGSIAKMEVLILDELASRAIHLDGEWWFRFLQRGGP